MGAPPPATPSQHTCQRLCKVMQAWGQVHNTLTSAISMHTPVPFASLPLCLTCNCTVLGVGVFAEHETGSGCRILLNSPLLQLCYSLYEGVQDVWCLVRHPHGNTDGVVLQRQLFLPLNLDAILRTPAGVARQLSLAGAASKALTDTIPRQSCDNFCP